MKGSVQTLGIIGRLSDAITLESLLYDILNISTDDMFLEAITDILENSTTWLVKSVQSSDIIYEWLCINNTQFKKLLRGRKLSLTDKVSENNCLNELIKGNAKILPLVIASLEPDAQMYEELIDLCVKYNNIKALNTVNNVYKK